MDTTMSMTIYAELGEINRFEDDRAVVSDVGLNPMTRESPDSRSEGSISKRGSGRVQWLLESVIGHQIDEI